MPIAVALAALAGLIEAPAAASSVTKTSASTVATTGAWNTPDNAKTRNSICTFPADVGTLTLTGYGFALPANASVTGVQLRAWAAAEGATANTGLKVIKSGASSSQRTVSTPSGICGSQSATTGADGDVWGLTLSPTEVNASTFGVILSGANPNGSFFYRVDAVEITVFYTVPPAAPSSLAASSQQNRVHLAWTDNSSDETAFSIERDDGAGGSFTDVGTTAANAVTADDATAACNTTYNYRVRAFRSSDSQYSSYSNTASVTHLCPDLQVTKGSSAGTVATGAHWTWTLTVSNAGTGPATLANGQVLLSDALPVGPTYGTVGKTLGSGVTGTLSCAVASGTLSCTATSAVVVPAASSVTVTVDAFSPSAGTFTNGATNCAVDPLGVLVESQEGNDACNSSSVTAAVPPAAPSGLSASPQQNGVHLAWTDNSSDETSFSVERASGGGSFAAIGTAPANAELFDDLTASCNVSYTYRVRAFRASDGVYSDYSSTAAATRDCPDLLVTKSSSVDEIFVGNQWTWTLAVTNVGSVQAALSSGDVLLRDSLPAGPTYGTVVATPGGGVTGPLSCAVGSGILTCAATGAVTIPATGAVTVTVEALSPAEGNFTNGASACMVDPDGQLTESLEGNNACNPSTVAVVATIYIFADGFEAPLASAWSGVNP